MQRIYAILTLALFGSFTFVEKESPTWWKETVFYEIYMPSYMDSDGDGYSDFKGLSSKLDYIEELGIGGIWLTPFLSSPKVDNGYDVSDYRQIDLQYGTMDDFERFIGQAHERGIRVIMDMVVNHTSTESYWFQESKKSKDNPYRDYYIWTDQPNNWESFFGGSAWEFDSASNEYYYHQFDKKMADLNWSNPKVVEEIQEVLRFWLDKGVDGFRLDVINFLTTDGITQDNPFDEKGEQIHMHDKDQNGVKEAMKIIKSTVNEYEDRFIVGEIGSEDIQELKQYQSDELMDVVFNFNFGSIPEFSAQRIYDEIISMEAELSSYPTLFFGSHDMPRLMSRLAENDENKAEALAALMLTAKGVPFIYYGEEIGMENISAANLEHIRDVQATIHYDLAIQTGKSDVESLQIANDHNRDKSRSPMQWNSNIHAGFSDEVPWIKVHENYTSRNVDAQIPVKSSLLNQYKKLIEMRSSNPVLQYGDYLDIKFENNVLSYTREFEGDKVTAVFNFSGQVYELAPYGNLLAGKYRVSSNSYAIIQH